MMRIRSLIFWLCWIVWCVFCVLWLGPQVAAHHLNDHRALITWILCIVPLILYAIVLVRSLKTPSNS
jgi:hypothetical protein